MTQFISGNSPPDVRDRFFAGCVHGETFLIVVRESSGSVIGIYAGHTHESVILHMAGDDTEEKDQHVISFHEAERIEVT